MTAKQRFEHDKAVAAEAESTLKSKKAEFENLTKQQGIYYTEARRLQKELKDAQEAGNSSLAESLEQSLSVVKQILEANQEAK